MPNIGIMASQISGHLNPALYVAPYAYLIDGSNNCSRTANGTSYTTITSPFTNVSVTGFAYGNSGYMALGRTNATTCWARYSADGVTWSTVTSPMSGSGNDEPILTVGDGTYKDRWYAWSYSNAYAAYSDNNGSTWTSFTVPYNTFGIAAGTGYIVGGGSGYSKNYYYATQGGLSFTTVAATVPVAYYWLGASYGKNSTGGRFMFGGAYGGGTRRFVLSMTPSAMSTPTVTEITVGSGDISYYSGYGAGVFYNKPGGTSTLYYSTDTVTWTATNLTSSQFVANTGYSIQSTVNGYTLAASRSTNTIYATTSASPATFNAGNTAGVTPSYGIFGGQDSA